MSPFCTRLLNAVICRQIRRLEVLQKFQQLSGSGALYVREIPNKPPPPYREPTEEEPRLSRADLQRRADRPATVVPRGRRRVLPLLRRACDELLSEHDTADLLQGGQRRPSEQFLSGGADDRSAENSGGGSDDAEEPAPQPRRAARRQYRQFLFQLAAAAVREAAGAGAAPPPPAWLRGRPARRLAARPPADAAALTCAVLRRTGVLLGFQPAAGRENLMVRWARKRRDRVDEVLVRELQEEEADWVSYDADAVTVKEQLSRQIADGLLTDATRQLMAVWRRRYVRQTDL